MKYMVGCVVWNKVDMLCWLLQGVNNAFPKGSHVVFVFDACKDDSVAAFTPLSGFWLHKKGYTSEAIVCEKEVREVGGHNLLMRRFMASDCDVLVVFQDDQHLLGPIVGLENVLAKHGDSMGVIGGRDGYNTGYGQFVGSVWSESTHCTARLQPGQFAERFCINSGPVIYTKPLINKVGYLDENFVAFFVWDDYGVRALHKNFVNGVIGTNLIHAKFGRVPSTTFYTKEISIHDNNRISNLRPEFRG
jgi:hypothetical protein